MAGQLINRGTRTWLIRVYLGRDASSGKRRYHNKTVHGTKKDAQAYLNKTLREKDLGVFVEPSRQPLNEFLDEWLKTTLKGRVAERTFDDYRAVLRRYVRPKLGSLSLSQITPLAVQGLYSEMEADGLSPRTIRQAHAVLRSALEQATRWRLIPFNPTKLVDLPRQPKQERRVLHQEEAARFLQEAEGDTWYALWAVLLTTGLRPGEALALKWSDLEGNRLRVQRALSRKRTGAWAIRETKTAGSRRTVTLPESLVAILRRHRAKQAERILATGGDYDDQGLIFATEKGHALDSPNLTQRHFKPLLKRAGLPDIRLYDLRHTCATLLLAAGEHPKIVSERLGHSSITLTLDTYSHVLPDMQQQAAEKLEGLLFQ